MLDQLKRKVARGDHMGCSSLLVTVSTPILVFVVRALVARVETCLRLGFMFESVLARDGKSELYKGFPISDEYKVALRDWGFA
ncbi:hypothetical protein DEO72_LG10g2201 [Vigna unguiculata]|uniref:Uncharacterized protein n=1 Tax=Vigna unguiculata TaxID=3917 RepID=A0A4D6NCD1_VIGUN|nr:hypothetical protein DEO72_LG10g2201 [Vigna unguiculata]